MPWSIKWDAPRSRLQIDAGKGMVLNEYTGTVKPFSSKAEAETYASLSHMRGAKILEMR